MWITRLFAWLRRLIWLGLIAAALFLAYVWLKPGPQDLPWTPLRLSDPIGIATRGKIVALRDNPAECQALLASSGLEFRPVDAFGADQCRVEDAIRTPARQPLMPLSPGSVAPSCPMAIGLILWHTQVVQPEAQAIFGAKVERIETYGSYSCRRMYGRSDGPWSEHATANAIDVSGFVLSDGRRISLLDHWSAGDDRARFLKAVRDGACTLFSTTLSPDYNTAHADHLHIDLANRGAMGWRACR